MAEEGGRDDLVAVRLHRLDRLTDDLGVEAGAGPWAGAAPTGDVAEEVEHGLAHRGGEREVGGHAEQCRERGRVAPARA